MFLRSVAAALGATVMITGACDAAHAMGNDPDQRVIRVITATYGASCRVAPGNATRDIAARCDGKRSCSYAVSYKVLSDPAYGCKKDFQVTYSCNGRDRLRAGAPAEAGYGSKVALACK